MSEEKKSFLDKAVDALTNRDEKEALEKAQREAAAAKRDAAQMRSQMASKKRTDDAKAAAKAKADKAAAAKATAAKAAAAKVSKQAMMDAKLSKKVGVVTEGLKLRSGPGEEFDPPIGWLKTGDKLDILEELEYWLKVNFEGKEGYVGKKYVKIS